MELREQVLYAVRNYSQHNADEIADAVLEVLAQQEPVARYNWHKAKVEWLQKWDFGRMNMKPLYLAYGAHRQEPPRPIETAPKDTFLLLGGPSTYTTIPFIWTTGRMCSDYKAGRWIDHANDDLLDWGFKPTHWMPLPEQPK